MRRRGTAAVSVACAAALVLSACGSDDEEPGADGGGGGGMTSGTLDIGLMTSLSGPAATASEASVRGADARFQAYEAADGECAGAFDFTIVEADDGSTVQGALAGAQKLVQQDDVDALISVSAFFFGAAPFLTTQASDVPVFGGAWDNAPEWSNTEDNLFSSFPVPNFELTYSAAGEFLKEQGATKVAGVAYNNSSSQGGLESAFRSIEAAGLERGYVNDTVPFGSTDIGPLVLGILDSGADAVYTGTNFDTSIALLAGLRQAGWDGLFSSPTGYGADLLSSEPAVQAGQGMIISSAFTPLELGTEAGTVMKDALTEYAGNEFGIPGFYESQGWFAADLLLHGLEKNGCDAGAETLISTLQTADDWDASGLYATPVPQSTVAYDETCSYYVTLEGDGFVPLNDGEPFCGELID
jgi:ABC-type branched-subunit amino acid transport system substrate-binding protein